MKLLIDGDIYLYKAASRAEKTFDWGDGLWSLVGDLKEAQGHIRIAIEYLKETLGSDDYVFCISDATNFRYELYEDYKGNRKSNRKPLVFKALREWAIKELGAVYWPNLEADDLMGIMATQAPLGDTVIVTIDKDLRSVPGAHYNPDKSEPLVTISEEEANKFHLTQSIAGDPTDNIKGVPGLGMKRAKDLLEKNGYTWETVVKAYEKAKLGPEEALLNARLTKILTASEWDQENRVVIPWEPEGLCV